MDVTKVPRPQVQTKLFSNPQHIFLQGWGVMGGTTHLTKPETGVPQGPSMAPSSPQPSASSSIAPATLKLLPDALISPSLMYLIYKLEIIIVSLSKSCLEG